MSNTTVLARVHAQLDLLQQEKITYHSFCTFLENSIEALENIPYHIVQKSLDFRDEFALAGFADECPEYLTHEQVIQKLILWLAEIEKLHSTRDADHAG